MIGRNLDPQANSRNWLGIAGATALTAALAIQLSGLANEEQSIKAEPQVIEQACDDTNYQVKDRITGDVIDADSKRRYGTLTVKAAEGTKFTSLSDKYFGGGPEGVSSLEASNPKFGGLSIPTGRKVTIQLSRFAETTLKEGKTLEEVAENESLDTAALVCLNGLNGDQKADKAIRVTIPKQQMDDTAGLTKYIVQSGDSYSAIGARLGVPNFNQNTANSIPPTQLRPGDTLFVGKKQQEEVGQTGGSEAIDPTSRLAEFVDKYADYAQAVEDKYDIPKLVVLAQAAHETGYGTSELSSSKAYNFFGIKAKEDWTGPTYTKFSPEEENGQMVQRESVFRAYRTAQDGFLGFGAYLHEESYGMSYDDALQHKDNPEAFVRALVNKGNPDEKVYATDSKYADRIVAMINRIKQVMAPSAKLETGRPAGDDIDQIMKDYPGNERFMEPTKHAGATTWDKRPLNGLSQKERLEASLSSLANAKPTKEGYEAFTVDASQIAAIKAYGPKSFNRRDNGFGPISRPKYFIPHFTTNSAEANAYDGKTFAGSQENTRRRNEIEQKKPLNGVGEQYYVSRIEGGAKSYQLTDNAAVHIGASALIDGSSTDMYHDNQVSVGAEVAAEEQAAITPEQYEQLLYLALKFIDDEGYLKSEGAEKAAQRIIGHAEANPDGHNDFPKVITDQFRIRLAKLAKSI